MYTVIVVDDEQEIRRGIVNKVRWEEIGFCVIGEADNGAEALEMVEKLEPDLLLTDICMPYLSGIELTRKVREIRPAVQIAFLSGFDDFEYAQQAIQYNIIDYILKPITAEELEQELVKIKKIIDEKYERFRSVANAQKQVEKSEFMLSLLLDGDDEDLQKLKEMAVGCGFLRNLDTGVLQYSVIVTSIFEGGENRVTRASVESVEMILDKYVYHTSCYLKGKVVSVLAATPVGFSKYLHILADEIVQSVNRIMGLECAIGVSRTAAELSGCRECYLEAMNALSYSRQREDSVHFIADEERVENVRQEQLDDIVTKTEELLRGGGKDELEGFLTKFGEEITEGKIAPALADFTIAQMAAAIFRVVYAVAGDEAVDRLQDNYQIRINHSVGQVLENFSQYSRFCLAAKEVIAEHRKKSGEILSDRALEMIRTRYADPELSIVSVSDEVAVSPNYLSSLIKKMTGKTFVELLTARRMEKAEELLRYTPKKIREIAEECGYRDQHYFSYCFKKLTGVSPNQCRRQHEEEDRKDHLKT